MYMYVYVYALAEGGQDAHLIVKHDLCDGDDSLRREARPTSRKQPASLCALPPLEGVPTALEGVPTALEGVPTALEGVSTGHWLDGTACARFD